MCGWTPVAPSSALLSSVCKTWPDEGQVGHLISLAGWNWCKYCLVYAPGRHASSLSVVHTWPIVSEGFHACACGWPEACRDLEAQLVLGQDMLSCLSLASCQTCSSQICYCSGQRERDQVLWLCRPAKKPRSPRSCAALTMMHGHKCLKRGSRASPQRCLLPLLQYSG